MSWPSGSRSADSSRQTQLYAAAVSARPSSTPPPSPPAPRVRHGGEDSEPQRAAELLGGVDQATGQARLTVAHAVYRHFAIKEALVAALAAEHFAGETRIAEAALEIDDPWQAFSTFVRRGAELMAENRAIAQIAADRPEVMLDAALAADAELGFFGTVQTLIDRAKAAGELRADFEFEDVPAVMCSLGALQVTAGAYANWRRLLEIMLDGLHCAGSAKLPPVQERLPRAG